MSRIKQKKSQSRMMMRSRISTQLEKALKKTLSRLQRSTQMKLRALWPNQTSKERKTMKPKKFPSSGLTLSTHMSGGIARATCQGSTSI